MIRTQISLDEKEYRLAKKSAKQQGISVAEYVRRAIRLSLSDADKPWMKYAGMVKSGNPNSSENKSIDDVVYGSKK
jgi:Ribbon-helix-helix protein, copG family